jgi:MFS family permease
LVSGAIAAGTCVIVIGLAPSAVAALLLIAVSGVGLSLLDATGRTMLQRSVSDETLARAFGLLEGFTMAGLGLGSILVPILVASLGLQPAIVVVGAILPALALLSAPGLRRIDARTVVPERELTLLAMVPMFAPLRPEVLGSLARHATWATFPAGATMIAEGDHGDRYYVLSTGVLRVSHEGTLLGTISEPGVGVGEIALLFDVLRTATVTVVEDAELLVLERPEFLSAVTGHPEVQRAVRRVADDRLREDR